jgi:hypothetical protein
VDGRFILGLDLGQAEDFSALCAVQQLYRGGAWLYHIRHLHRWPLGTSYVRVADDVVALLRQPPLQGAVLLVDATGAGRPVVDMLRQRQPPCQLVPAVITGGAQSSVDGGFWHVAKRELVSTMQVLVGSARYQVAQALPLARVLESEFGNFRARVVAATGHEVLEAPWREGMHDDMLLAVALACWYGERRPPAVEAEPIVLVPGRADPTAAAFWGDPGGAAFISGRNRTGTPDGPAPRVIPSHWQENWPGP